MEIPSKKLGKIWKKLGKSLDADRRYHGFRKLKFPRGISPCFPFPDRGADAPSRLAAARLRISRGGARAGRVDRQGTGRLTAHAIEAHKSRYGAFSHLAFTVMWIATTCSLTGVAISDTASAWLMTNLNADPRAVTMVQAASSLSMFLFTIPAGALADMMAPRRYLLILESIITVLIAIFGFMVLAEGVDAKILIIATFILSAFWSIAAPAWLSITPMLVPPRDLDSANAANSVGYNISRALGPVLAGAALSALGPASPYPDLCRRRSDVGRRAALVRPRAHAETGRSSESLIACTMTGFRHAAANEDLKATMVRVVAVYPFACAYTALLPLVARKQMEMGPGFYGILLAVASVGAVIGSLLLAPLRARFSPDLVVALGTVGIAVGLVLFGLAHEPVLAVLAALIAGASWTIVLVGLYVSALISLPEEVRARGLGIFLTVIFGCVTAGSMAWGQIAAHAGLPFALFAAAAGVLLAIPLSWSAKLKSAPTADALDA